MIKFKEHDGLIFKMLEEHEILPLKENDVNVLVRFITHGVIGEYVMEHWLDCNQENVPIYVENVDSDGDVTVCIENGNEHHCCPFPMFEIIGTLVKDGSKEWAWHMMQEGYKTKHCESTSQRFYAIRKGNNYCAFYDNEWKEVDINTRRTYCEFIEYAKAFPGYGWRILKEHEQPKPLLADAKVGDLCQRRDGKYVQVDSYSNDRPCPVMCKSDIGGQDCFTLDGRNHNATNNDKDIIYTEPLAPEGTKEWAWQMMLLGKIIIHSEYRHENATWKMNNGTARSCLAGMSACSKEQWVANAVGNGWQLCEPKPKPLLADAKIGWRVLFSNNESRTIQDIVTHKNLPKRYVMNEAIVQQLVDGGSAVTAAFNEDGTAYTHFCGATPEFDIHATYAYDPKATDPKPEPTFKIGDWVKYDIDSYLQVIEPSDKERTLCKTLSGVGVIVYPYTSLLTKVSPSEVVVQIGCLSGTIAKSCDPNYFLMWHSSPSPDRDYSIIKFTALDKQTRELVEGLLKEQNEDKRKGENND